MNKYKVGQRKVLMVDEIHVRCSDGTKLITQNEDEIIYLYSNNNENLEIGQLIVGECVGVYKGGFVSDWKRISDE